MMVKSVYILGCDFKFKTGNSLNLRMGFWRQIGQYLWIVKKDPDSDFSKMTKAMHFINRLSILLFLLAMIILIVQLIRR
ncbi:MAG: DUF6728 family protein [Ginsengibacter sp.]